MTFYAYLFLVFGFPLVPHAVKVIMQGSLSLGKEVMDTISHYLKMSNYNLDGRRSMPLNDNTLDTISLIVNSAFLCRDLNLCHETLNKFLNEYIIMMTQTVESVFEGLLLANTKEESEKKIPEGVIFEDELKEILHIVKEMLNHADKNVNDKAVDERFIWFDLLKRINAKFQERATIFASERLQGNAEEVNEVMQKMIQKLVIESSSVELEFGQRLCVEERVCIKSYEVTSALATLLERLQKLPDDKMKAFIRYFYETLPDTSFYHRINDVTANEFQAILNDMAYAENIHTKNVLKAVLNTVDDRLNSINHKLNNSIGRDIKLVHIILSDMDHFYSQQANEPFHHFMDKFYEWMKSDSRFSSPVRQVMKDIADTISIESDELVTKLNNEVRVFLEITVDPEK